MPAYTWQNALDYCRPFVKNIPVAASTVDIVVADEVNSIVHISYPWRWTLGSLTAIALSDGVQDYSITDTDVLRPVNLRLTRTDLTPDEFRELRIVEFLAPELTRKGGLETIELIAYDGASSKFRLDKAASIQSPTVLQINGEYQKQPTKITALTQAPFQGFTYPDAYFPMFTSGLLWKLYKLADDPRAGNVVITRNGDKQYSGQLGVFFDMLKSTIIAEDWGFGQPIVFPVDPIGTRRYGSAGLFGLY